MGWLSQLVVYLLWITPRAKILLYYESTHNEQYSTLKVVDFAEKIWNLSDEIIVYDIDVECRID